MRAGSVSLDMDLLHPPKSLPRKLCTSRARRHVAKTAGDLEFRRMVNATISNAQRTFGFPPSDQGNPKRVGRPNHSSNTAGLLGRDPFRVQQAWDR